ncbi:MAG: hypothetical protein IPL86_12110 [Flavobacteriales bacterium]|nr:hypothetical protein [Flavobacteriales bacterium]
MNLTLQKEKATKHDKDIMALEGANETPPCQDYFAYYVGLGTPGPPQLQWERVEDLSTLPGLVRFTGVGETGAYYYRAFIGSDLCGVPIPLIKGDASGKLFLQSADPEGSGNTLSRRANATEFLGLDASSVFAKYRVVYDVATDEIYVQRWVRPRKKNPAHWVNVNDRIIRPGVNRMVDVKYVNFNALRDSLSLEFQWDQYNLDGSDEFLNAVTRGPSIPPAPAEKATGSTKEEEKGKIEAKDDSLKAQRQSFNMTKDDCADREKVLKLLLAKHKQFVDELKKDQAKVDVRGFQNSVRTILIEKLGVPLELDEKETYRVQLDSSFIACKANWNADTLNKGLKDLRDARDIYQKKMDLDALSDMATAFEAVGKKAKAAALTPSLFDLRDTLVAIARKHFAERFAEEVDASSLKALGEIADKAKEAGILNSVDAVAAYKKQAEAMSKTYNELTMYRTGSIAPLQMHDYDVLSLQFKKNGTALNASPYEIQTSGGWKIDFSTGIVFSKVRDEHYFYSSLRTVSTIRSDTTMSISGGDTTTTVMNTDSTKYMGAIGANTPDEADWGLTVMAHFYPRTGLVFNGAFSLGMLLKQDGVSPMLGLSILCGRRHRAALTGGVIFANVMRLSSGYEVGAEYEVTSSTGLNSEVPNTERVIRTGFFASLTYNFAGARITKR